MRNLLRLTVLALAAVGAKSLFDRYGQPIRTAMSGSTRYGGTDTPTGTDPAAKHRGPGFEEKSFGQATASDQTLAEKIAEESTSEAEADARFRRESAGSPALARQDPTS